MEFKEAITQKNKIYTAIYNQEALASHPPIVLVRGLGRVIEHWHGFQEILADNHPVIVLDNKGMGRSKEGIGLSATISDFAGHLLEVLDCWEVPKAHLVGISLGGMIVIETTRQFPERVLSYCAINSSAQSGLALRLFPSGLYEFGKQGVTGGKSEETLFNAMVATKDPEKKEKWLLEWGEIRAKYGLNGYNTFCQLKAAVMFCVRSDWEQIQTPGLIAVSTKDKLVPPSNSSLLAEKLPNAELVRFEGAGHELLMDAPQEFVRSYREFLDAI